MVFVIVVILASVILIAVIVVVSACVTGVVVMCVTGAVLIRDTAHAILTILLSFLLLLFLVPDGVVVAVVAVDDKV